MMTPLMDDARHRGFCYSIPPIDSSNQASLAHYHETVESHWKTTLLYHLFRMAPTEAWCHQYYRILLKRSLDDSRNLGSNASLCGSR